MSRAFVVTLGILALVMALAAGQAMAVEFVGAGSLDLGRPGDDPAAAGTWSYDAGTLTHTIEGGGSDWWNNGEYAHLAYEPVSGAFWIEAEVTWYNRTGTWGDMDNWVKAGVAIRNDIDNGPGNEKEVNYINANLRPGHSGDEQDVTFQWRDVATQNMGSEKMEVDVGGPDEPTRKVALNRWIDGEGDSLVQAFAEVGGVWQELPGTRWAWNLNEDVYAGLFVTAHNNDRRLEKADFVNAQILPAQTPTPVPYKPGDPIADPEGVAPVVGGWGVLEVLTGNAPNMNSVATAAGVLENVDPAHTRHTYNLMGPINIGDSDPQGDAKNFPGDGPYGVVDAGLQAAGAVDDIAFLARGKIKIPAGQGGPWTFYINSDDGEALTIDDRALVIGTESWDVSSFGTVNLTPGVHDIQVVHREDGGGADVEVAAAIGETTDLNNFRLIGSGDPGRPAFTFNVPGYTGVVNIEGTKPGDYAPGSRDEALLAIVQGRTAGTNSTAVAEVVNHSDPDDGGNLNAGAFPNDIAFPNDAPGADDNDFATLVTGALHIPDDGTWFLGFNSDDGGALQIMGQSWTGVVADATGNAVIDADWLKTDAWTGWSYTVGEIELAAGDYDFNFVSYEGGGGAFVEVFGSDVLGFYDLIYTGTGHDVFVPAVADALELVPEPATWLMLVSGMLAMGLMWFRRRRT